ncbi:MAG: hypothetical protein JRH08_17120 [Deltaproteobacteria bacterium]|nr:hypothetical protein [Deltaproteobacteria bacterium]
MPSDQFKHIERIRKECEASQRIKDSLNNSIQALAHDLYSKETHFILELIQNAEDNIYNDANPSLSFQLVKNDPTATPKTTGALIIQNNEIGFSPANVDAICAIGITTKSKIQGYIGEKGIGFKAVFRVTSTPYIFSGGYYFCLPEKDEETGLGYIVPRWVKAPPEDIDLHLTTIILPLDKPDFTYEKIKKMLQDIEPETILFLSKLKELQIIIEKEGKFTILKDDSKAPLVQILIEGERQGNPLSEINEFLLYTKTINKPEGITHEKRKDIDKRDVSIAFPLGDNEENAGKVFAYLPVRYDTGLPFLINADFILTSSREGILEGLSWNEWLRDCICEVFVTAFESWLEIKEYRSLIFGYIPLEADYSFFDSIVKSIHDELKNRTIIPTEPDGRKCKPEKAIRAPSKFRNLLSGNPYPKALLKRQRIVLSEIEKYRDQLEAIGIGSLTLDLVEECFQEKQWIMQHDYDWLLKCYRYLSSQNFSEELLACPIVPIKLGNGIRWSCDKERPIYFECDEECQQLFQKIPECLREISLGFLDSDFFDRLKDDRDIREWMTKMLNIYPFTKKNYAIDILNWLGHNYNSITNSDLVAATTFLCRFADTGSHFDDLPVLLSDGGKMLLAEARNLSGIQAVVTPEGFDPKTGWQLIWQTDDDRGHFVWLSDAYSKECINRLLEIGCIDKYPLPRRSESKDTPFSVTKIEENYLAPNKLPGEARAMIAWLKYQSDRDTPVAWPKGAWRSDFIGKCEEKYKWANKMKYYEQDGQAYRVRTGKYQFKVWHSDFLKYLRERQWLPTTKGLRKPRQAFLAKESIKEILGDFVPYFEDQLPEDIIKLLGIQTEVTSEKLVSLLEEYSERKDNGNKNLAERIYRTLGSRELSDDILKRFQQAKLIFVPGASGQHWVSTKGAIWKDLSDTLCDDFVYLEKKYGAHLKEFFVDQLDWLCKDIACIFL